MAIVAAGSLAASTQVDLAEYETSRPLLYHLLKFTLSWAWLAWILTASVALAEVVRRKIGMPWVWVGIHRILDVYAQQVFKDSIDTDEFSRVTLFQYKKLRWDWFCFWREWFRFCPWGGWLVPVERSGHTYRKRGTCFKAPDAADKAKGISGIVWASKRIVTVEGLPNLCEDCDETELSLRVKDYAELTWTTPEWVSDRIKGKKSLERSFCGIPVEVGNKMWGVIVVSSRSPSSLESQSLKMFTQFAAGVLDPLLERA